MPKVLVIEIRGQRDVVVLMGVNGTVFAVEERAVITQLAERLAHQAADREGRIHRVLRIVDGAFLIEMSAGEIE